MADHPMKIRAVMSGGVADVKVLISHPMDSGLLKNAKTGQAIPAHYIKELTATLNGKTVMQADWNGEVSKNPFLNFRIKGAKAGDTVAISWTDNLGETGAQQATIS